LSSLFRRNGENSYDACVVGKNKLYYARHLAESLWQAETKLFDEKALSLPGEEKCVDNERLALVCMGVLCLM
jgi:hypothetical protein